MTAPFQPSREDLEWQAGLRDLSRDGLNKQLCEAVDMGSAWRVRTALKAGADVHTSGDQPIRRAAVLGHFEVARALVEAGANLRVNDEEPLSWAARGGNVALVEFFLSRGASEKSWGGQRAKNWAHDYGQRSVTILFNHAAEVRSHIAETGASFAESIALLLESGGALPLEEIKKGSVKGQICLYVLGAAKKLDLLFAPDVWLGKKDDMIKLWNRLPQKYRDDVDISSKVSALGAHTLKSLKPPKLKFDKN